jgi:hypothetical protein
MEQYPYSSSVGLIALVVVAKAQDTAIYHHGHSYVEVVVTFRRVSHDFTRGVKLPISAC